MRFASFAVLVLPILANAGCATAPRAAAGKIADAGVAVTTTFQSDIGALADQLATGSVTEAFVLRWQLCQNPSPAICGMPLPADPALDKKRRDLADAVRLRARALAALGAGYAALKNEAKYDARADISAATNDAVKSVNNFVGVIYPQAGAAIPAAVAPLVGEVAGIIADRKQRNRILRANAKLREIALRLRDALQKEQEVFGTIAAVTAQRRQEAMIALFQSGLLPGDQLIKPMIDSLGLTLGSDAAATIRSSPKLQAAVIEAARAQTELAIARIDERYDASIAALTSLANEQGKLAAQRDTISLAEVDRLLAVIVASLGDKKPAPAPTASEE